MAANRVKKPVYVDTNLNTRVVVLVPAHCSARRFRKKFLEAHRNCYPNFGKLKVQSLQVKHKSEFTGSMCFYHLSGTIPIEDALGGEDRFLHVEALEKTRKKKKDSVVEVDDSLACEECGSGDNEEEILICDECNKGFHLKCLRPILVRIPIGDWYCYACSPPKPTTLTRTEVREFFGIKDSMELMERPASVKDSRKRRSLVYSQKKSRLLPYQPTKDESQRLQQMESLASALMYLKISFSPQLTYVPGMAPRSANDPKLENGGMQVLTEEDKKTLNYVDDMGKAGVLPPLMVVYDSHIGYTVETCGPIKDWTLVAEYVGDVDYLRNRENDDCDSLMTLLSAKDTAQSLVICPDKRGNIARFISGINNHLPESKKKLNLKCVRYDVNGECRALLVATRDIAEGERLYYDYNGLENEPFARAVDFCQQFCEGIVNISIFTPEAPRNLIAVKLMEGPPRVRLWLSFETILTKLFRIFLITPKMMKEAIEKVHNTHHKISLGAKKLCITAQVVLVNKNHGNSCRAYISLA